MQCRNVLTRLDAVRTGEIGAPVATEITNHLQGCGSCERTAHAVEELSEALRSHVVTEGAALRRRAIVERIRNGAVHSFDRVMLGGRPFLVAFSRAGITMTYPGDDAESFRVTYRERYGRSLEQHPMNRRFVEKLERASEGGGCDGTVVDITSLRQFEQNVLRGALSIPKGEVRTYSWLARELGSPGAVRAVGNALAKNPVAPILPCHRVVPASGGIGNYAFGSLAKRELLRREGVAVDELDALARRGVRYIGCSTTGVYCFPTCRDVRRINAANRRELRDERSALEEGFRPCKHCRPLAGVA